MTENKPAQEADWRLVRRTVKENGINDGRVRVVTIIIR
jgi:hypothetical protein